MSLQTWVGLTVLQSPPFTIREQIPETWHDSLKATSLEGPGGSSISEFLMYKQFCFITVYFLWL